MASYIAIICRFNQVIAFAVRGRPPQFPVFRMCPQERHGGAGLPPKVEMTGRQVRYVPDLLGYQTNASGKLLEGTEIRFGITAGGQLVMASLAREQGPRTPDSPTVK